MTPERQWLRVECHSLLKNFPTPRVVLRYYYLLYFRTLSEFNSIVPKDQTRGAIYSIPCKDCDKRYIGETKRKFSTRLKEHQKAVEHKHSQKSALAEHCLRSGHTVSWEASKILRTSANWRNRRILEAREINTCRNPLNRDDGMHLRHEFLNLALRDRT